MDRAHATRLSIKGGGGMTTRRGALLLVMALLALAWASVLRAAPAHAATFTVDSTADEIDVSPGDGQCQTPAGGCTLRAAIIETNALPGVDTVVLPAGTYTLTIAGRGEDAAATGDLDVADGTHLTGAGPALTIVDGNALDRVFHVLAAASISGLTVRNGDAGGGGASGGGIAGRNIIVRDVTITGNTAPTGSGGGIAADGLVLANATISNNVAQDGAGLLLSSTATSLTNFTVTGNRAPPGAFFPANAISFPSCIGCGGVSPRLENGTIGENAGNGIVLGGNWLVTLVNTTVSQNSGDGIAAGCAGTPRGSTCGGYALTNVTINGNAGIGVRAVAGTGNPAVVITVTANSIIGGNASGNCSGPLRSLGSNLDSGATCGFSGPGDLSNTEPRLGPLADNGGTTRTHALLAGSPAIDAGAGTACPIEDQRGFQRPRDGDGDGVIACDIGAYEAGAILSMAPSRTFVVNTTADAVDANAGDGICETGPGNGLCSLRAAILEANASPAADTISLPVGAYVLTRGGFDTYAAVGDLDVRHDLTITGAGADSTVVDGRQLEGIIRIGPIARLSMSGVTLRDGAGTPLAFFPPAAIYNEGSLMLADARIVGGGAVYGVRILNRGVASLTNLVALDNSASSVISNSGILALARSRIEDNVARGILNHGAMTLTEGTISNNQKPDDGSDSTVGVYSSGSLVITNATISRNGGPGIVASGKLVVTDASISENTGGIWGGGIEQGLGTAVLTRVTISGNRAQAGGGIFSLGGSLIVTNSTISGNSGWFEGGATQGIGGGLHILGGSAVLTNVTVADNVAPRGGAIAIGERAQVQLKNTILANSRGGGDCSGAAPISLGNNLDSDATCRLSGPGDLSRANPRLGPLADNGGPTRTHALLGGSVAIDAGSSSGCPATDQRRLARPRDGDGAGAVLCDIGAYELQAPISPTDLAITVLGSPGSVPVGAPVTYTLTVRNNGPLDATGVTLIDRLPAGLTLGPVRADRGSCSHADSTLSCSLGSLANGAEASVTVVVIPTVAGTLTSSATVAADQSDPVATNNTAGVSTTVLPSADLSVAVTGSPDPVVTGARLTSRIAVANGGPSPATGVTLTVILPEGVGLDSVTPNRGSCSPSAGVVTCPLGTLDRGSAATVQIEITPRATGTLTTTARVVAIENDPAPANNEARSQVQAKPPPSTCSPRPDVRLATTSDGPGRLRVTISAGTSSATPSNRLRELRFVGSTNAAIDIPAGPSGRSGQFTERLPEAPQSATFVVRRIDDSRAVHVPLVVVDDCGEWPTFVGGGPTAF